MPARRSSRHHRVNNRGRMRPVLGVILTGVVVAVLAFVTTTTTARILLASGAETATGTACPSSDPASPAACPTAAPGANSGIQAAAPALPAPAGSPTGGSRTGAPRVSGARPAGSPTAEHQPSTARAQPDPAPATSTPPVPESDFAEKQVLTLINRARAGAGLPGYTITAGLHLSASRHNELMAAGCGLAHQCRGEPPLGERESAAGVHWTSAGENIGEGGPVPDSPAAIAQMALVLTKDMLRERPPDDGHRRNLLSTAFHHIGIAIFRDRQGTVWMTQDFSN